MIAQFRATSQFLADAITTPASRRPSKLFGVNPTVLGPKEAEMSSGHRFAVVI